jgi:hypothetical protein
MSRLPTYFEAVVPTRTPLRAVRATIHVPLLLETSCTPPTCLFYHTTCILFFIRLNVKKFLQDREKKKKSRND